MEFSEMRLMPQLLKAVDESGYTNPTPIQEQTITPVLDKRDILGCAQTGSGKTAAFALPILQLLSEKSVSVKRIRSLVLAPTRELAIQNFECFVSLGKHLPLKTVCIFGGVNQASQVSSLRAGADILVATPGRLLDLMHQGFIDLSGIEIFVLDEADRMLDMGFIHDVKAVIAALPKKRQTLFFSATMPKEAEELASSLLCKPCVVKVDAVNATVDTVEQCVYFISHDRKKDLLKKLITECGVYSALVFTRTKSNANQVAQFLNKNGISAMAIHGNKSQNARQAALTAFKANEISVLCATDIAARGIDIIELPYVINYNIPEEPETYIHRIGRTGRAGLSGKAISFCCSDELKDFRDIEKLTKADIKTVECEWSVKDMLPTVKVKQQRPPRQSRRR